MDKKENFKEFLRKNPKLINYIKKKDSSIQKLYEIYDVYGENDDVWKEYLSENNFNLNNISDIVKNIDVDSIKNHISTAQKALDVVQELTGKASSKIGSALKKPLAPKPLNKFFGD